MEISSLNVLFSQEKMFPYSEVTYLPFPMQVYKLVPWLVWKTLKSTNVILEDKIWILEHDLFLLNLIHANN